MSDQNQYLQLIKKPGTWVAAGLMTIGALSTTAISFEAAAPKPLEQLRHKISDYVLQLASVDGQNFPAIILLKDQVDLKKLRNEAERVPDRAKRIQVVYDALRNQALNTQTDLLNYLKGEGVDHRPMYIRNAIVAYALTPSQLAVVAARSDVEKVVGNPAIQGELPLDFPGQNNVFEESLRDLAIPSEDSFIDEEEKRPGANIIAVGADRVWKDLKVKGEGIVVAGQDTGVQWDHPALKPHYRGYDNATGAVTHDYYWHDAIHHPIVTDPSGKPRPNPCGYANKAPCDDNNHGTHTLGTVVGDDGAGNQIGVAPGATWVGCRNMDQGYGTPATYTECFEFFLAPFANGADPLRDGRPDLAPHVINNSWGCPESEGCEGDEMLPVLEALEIAGILVVASAGNYGSACETIKFAPAHHSANTLSVGAHNDRDGKIANFSSRGPSKYDGSIGPDVTAPGVNVRSAVRGSSYAQFGYSGTSMAGPHVVGQVALIWSAQNKLIGDVAATSEIIRSTAKPTTSTEKCGGVEGTEIPNNTYGHGQIDTFKSVEAVLKQ